MSTLDQGVRSGKSLEQNEAPSPVFPSPGQEASPPNRILRVKIWENKAPADPSFSEEDTIFPDESAVFPEDPIENLPTALMEATSLKPPTQGPSERATWSATNQAPTLGNPHRDDVAQISTSRLVSQRQILPEEPLNRPWQPPMQRVGDRDALNRAPTFQKPPMTSPQRPHPPFQAPSTAQGAWQPGLINRPLAPVSIVTKPVSREGISRKRLAIVLILLFIVIGGGIAAWIIAFQPFAVASITQPWQQFCDAGLGISERYPTGWMKQVEQKKAVRFSDGIDQFNIITVAANGQDAGKYLQNEASQLGITGLKLGTPISFAGATWQQAQGNLLQSQTGVTYKETLLVTMHGNRFFTIMQIAPPSTYNEEDKTIFTEMRSSFQFSNSCT